MGVKIAYIEFGLGNRHGIGDCMDGKARLGRVEFEVGDIP
jgi:hypothetical protein